MTIESSQANAVLIDAGFARVQTNDYVRAVNVGDKKLQFNIRESDDRFRVSLSIRFPGGFTGGRIEMGSIDDAHGAVGMVNREVERRANAEAEAEAEGRGDKARISPDGHFTPTDEQIRCAQELMVAMAYEATLRPIVEGYEREILAKHRFKMAAKWGERTGPEGGVILEAKHAFLLDEHDAKVYLDECRLAQEAHGLKASKPENCPLLEAEHARRVAENALLKAWEGDPRFSSLAEVGTMLTTQRAKVIDLTLGLLAPYMKGNAHDMLADMGIEPPEPEALASASSPEL